MGDKDNMMFDNCSLFYCNKPIELPPPVVDVALSSEQIDSDDEKVKWEKWDNQCGRTITFTHDVKVKKFTNKERRIFYGKYWKLPRKLKKMAKRKYFVRYQKRISRYFLAYVYLLNNQQNNI